MARKKVEKKIQMSFYIKQTNAFFVKKHAEEDNRTPSNYMDNLIDDVRLRAWGIKK